MTVCVEVVGTSLALYEEIEETVRVERTRAHV